MPTVHCPLSTAYYPLPTALYLHPIPAKSNPAHLTFLRGDSRGVTDRFSPRIVSVLLLPLFSVSVGV